MPFGESLQACCAGNRRWLGWREHKVLLPKFLLRRLSPDAQAAINILRARITSSFILAAGIRFYVTPHFFIRPQIDAHWVNNFYQFGSNWVPEYGAAVGWSFSSH